MSEERYLRAMKHSLHRAARTPGTECCEPNCKKTCVADSDYCIHHRNLRIPILTRQKSRNDLNVYGA